MTTFPVTESTLSAKALELYLQQQYGFNQGTKCKLFRTGMNHLYLVRDKDKQFVFRIYTFNWRTKLDISEELRLLLHLKAMNTSVSFPIPDSQNELIQELNAPEGKRYGVLFSFADGIKTARFSPQASYLIGQKLAGIHQAMENFVVQRITYDPKVLLKESMERTKAFFNHDLEDIRFLDKLADYLSNEFEQVNMQQIRQGAVHLDVWFDNMHFNEEKDVIFYDFDFCGNGWLCFDVSYFLFQLYTTNLNEADYIEKAENFLKGYESVVPISSEEKRILPFVCLAIMTFYISMQCDRYDSWSNIFLNEDHLKRFVGNLKRWINYNGLKIAP